MSLTGYPGFLCRQGGFYLRTELALVASVYTGGYYHLKNSYKTVTILSARIRNTVLRGAIMKKLHALFTAAILTGSLLTTPASATSLSHRVVSGDTMWKLAVQYQVGTSEIIQANPQVSNPNLIYPGQILQIPQLDSAVASYEAEVIRLVNEIRQQNGLRPLTPNWELSRVARYKSRDMLENGYFSHNSPTYGSPFQMITAFGLSYRTAGENIAKGYPSPQAVVNGWMNSSGHRANILNASYKQIGVGYVSSGNYWTQMFIG